VEEVLWPVWGGQRWKGRWESSLPLRPPFDDPSLTMQPTLLAIVQARARLLIDMI
jgi:hypothetical protein